MIKISSLIAEDRRRCTVKLTVKEGDSVRQEELRIDFLKPTEILWRKVVALETEESIETPIRVEQLIAVDLQSEDILNEDGSQHRITRDDLLRLDALQILELWSGVKEHFFPQTPVQSPSNSTNSTSEPAES